MFSILAVLVDSSVGPMLLSAVSLSLAKILLFANRVGGVDFPVGLRKAAGNVYLVLCHDWDEEHLNKSSSICSAWIADIDSITQTVYHEWSHISDSLPQWLFQLYVLFVSTSTLQRGVFYVLHQAIYVQCVFCYASWANVVANIIIFIGLSNHKNKALCNSLRNWSNKQ